MENDGTQVCIREFSWPEDYPALVELWKAVEMYNPGSDGQENIRSVWERNPGLFLVAVEPGRGIVGSVIGTFDGRRGYLYHVAVHPACRRQGYGRMLVREVEERIWALGARKIRFMVQNGNEAAKAFYRSLGFDVDHHAFAMSKSRPRD